MNQRYQIIRPRLHPDFDLPNRSELLKLAPGDSVKLMFKVGDDNVERMWVTLTNTLSDEIWSGTIDSEATQAKTMNALPVDKKVNFHPLDIISIY
jgi:hypothetical protein